jgi:hypothetical protein
MVIKTIKLLFKTNTSETEKDFKGLNDTLDDTAKANDKVNESFDVGATFAQKYGDELQPLTTRIGEAEDRLYELALAGDTTSKEYQALLERVSEYRKVQIATDQVVDGAAQTMTQKLGSALNGVTSGFALTQGSLALFGKENEALEKSLLKVQAALAIQQGVDGLRTSYKELGGATGIATSVQKGFNAVLKANPIMLIVSGIIAVVGALATFTDVLDPIIDKLKAFGDFLGITNFEEEELNAERRRRAEEERQRIEAERKQREQAFNQRQSEFDREIALLEAEGKSSFELTQQKIQNSIAYQKEKIKEIELEIEALELLQSKLPPALLKASGAQEELNKRKESVIELNNNILDSENQLKINVINNDKKKAESYKAYTDKKEEERKKDAERELDALKKERARLQNLENLENEFLDRIAKIEEENYQRTLTDEERELRAVQDKYFELETLAEGNAEQLNIIEEARLNEENEIRLKYQQEAYDAKKALDDQADADQQERDKQAKAKAKALEEYKVNVVQGGLSAINDIAQLFAKGNEKQQKRAFQIQKAVGIAQATINTAQAITKVFAETTDFTPTQSLRIANAVAIGVAGAAQIASIASQQFQGGGDVETPGNIGGGAGGEAVAPQFNVVGDSGVNQLAQLQQQPVQAYVVSGEVTTSQALDRNRVENATL